MSDIIGELTTAGISGEIAAGTVILNQYVLTVSDITGGNRLTIVKGDQTQTLDVMDGAKGDKGDTGEDGADGFSPTVSVAEITGGHRVTITDATGAHTFDVMDGQAGDIMLVDQLDESLLDEVANLEYRVCMLELFGGVTE